MEKPKYINAINNFITFWSKELGVEAEIVIHNIIIRYMAEKQASLEVWGETVENLPEFCATDEGIVTGEELFNVLVEEFKQKYSDEKRRVLINRLKNGMPIERFPQEDLEFLKLRGVITDKDVEVRALANEARASGLVPASCKKDDVIIAMFWQSVKEGKMTNEDFTKQLELETKSGHGSPWKK